MRYDFDLILYGVCIDSVISTLSWLHEGLYGWSLMVCHNEFRKIPASRSFIKNLRVNVPFHTL
jgi:hypothetical protein